MDEVLEQFQKTVLMDMIGSDICVTKNALPITLVGDLIVIKSVQMVLRIMDYFVKWRDNPTDEVGGERRERLVRKDFQRSGAQNVVGYGTKHVKLDTVLLDAIFVLLNQIVTTLK